MSGRESDALLAQVIASMELHSRIQSIAEAARQTSDWRERLNLIRRLYKAFHEMDGDDIEFCDPYALGINDLFTYIEDRLWQDTRAAGLNMVPQYPVGPYVVDFANPKRRIAIEADGRQFHDAERDKARDQRLWDAFGWKVYRSTGRECHRVVAAPWELIHDRRERGLDKLDDRDFEAACAEFFNTSEGLAIAIREIEYGGTMTTYHRVMARCLDEHRLADFPIGGQA